MQATTKRIHTDTICCTSGTFLPGFDQRASVTVADCAVLAFLHSRHHHEEDESTTGWRQRAPALAAFYDRMAQLPRVREHLLVPQSDTEQ